MNKRFVNSISLQTTIFILCQNYCVTQEQVFFMFTYFCRWCFLLCGKPKELIFVFSIHLHFVYLQRHFIKIIEAQNWNNIVNINTISTINIIKNINVLLSSYSLENGKLVCRLRKPFPTVLVTSLANRLKWPGNFPSWKCPVWQFRDTPTSALNQCRHNRRLRSIAITGACFQCAGVEMSFGEFPISATVECATRQAVARALVVLFQCYLGNDGARFVCCHAAQVLKSKGKFASTTWMCEFFVNETKPTSAAFFNNCGLA